MKVMIGLNVILDVVENRSQWVESSARVCSIAGAGLRANGVVPSHAVTTLYYIVRRKTDKRTADKTIDWLLALFDVAICGKQELRRSRELRFADFEDAVVAASAESSGCDYIVTRNVADFAHSPIKAIAPDAFIGLVAKVLS